LRQRQAICVRVGGQRNFRHFHDKLFGCHGNDTLTPFFELLLQFEGSQGDRIFAHWVIVYYGMFSVIKKSAQIYWKLFSTAKVM
jgi:hypothetical protein